MRWFRATLLAVIAHLSLVVAAPVPDQEDLGFWTVDGFRRECDAEANECRISFKLTLTDGADTTDCSFTVKGFTDSTEQLNFRGAQCEETYYYTISSGWNSSGFTVVVIHDEFLGLQSFFGFRDDELVDGKAAESKIRDVQRSRPDGGEQAPRDDEPEEEEEGLDYADGWKLTDVKRDAFVNDEDEIPTVETSFNIEHPDFEAEACKAMAYGGKGEDPKTMSFYDVSCIESNWTLSWGYDDKAEEDVAIMTLMSPSKNRRAYFGFRYVNGDEPLGENGPEPVYPY